MCLPTKLSKQFQILEKKYAGLQPQQFPPRSAHAPHDYSEHQGS